MVRAGGRHRPCARQGRRSAHAAFPRVPRLNFTDTRNWRPTSDVTVTLDGATLVPAARAVRPAPNAGGILSARKSGSKRKPPANCGDGRSAAAGVDVADYDHPTTSNRLESATVGDVAYEFSHDTSGHVTTYDAATGDDRFVAWNARGLAARIVLGPAAPSGTTARTVQVPVDDGRAESSRGPPARPTRRTRRRTCHPIRSTTLR